MIRGGDVGDVAAATAVSPAVITVSPVIGAGDTDAELEARAGVRGPGDLGGV